MKRNDLDFVKCVFRSTGREISILLLQVEPDVFSYHTRTHCLLKEMHFLFLSDGSDKFEICCSITFVFVTFLCFYIGFTCFGGSAGLNVKSNLSFDYIRPCCLTDNEFNLELVHFNNSTALIAGLKGFALF